MSAQAPSSPTLGDLVSQLAQKTGVLVSQEIRLAKTELTANVKTAGRNVAWVAIGAFALMVGVLFLLIAVLLLLGMVMPYWLASLILGGFVIAAGAGAAAKGAKALKDLDPAPRETIRTLKEDTAWAKAQLSR